MAIKKKHLFQNPAEQYPAFVNVIMEATRALVEQGGIMYIHTDNTARTAVSFICRWRHYAICANPRRVFLETCLTETGCHRLIFTGVHLLEDPPIKEYTVEALNQIPKDILNYLHTGLVP